MMLTTFLLISVVVLGPVYVCADTFIKSDDGDLAFSTFTITGDEMEHCICPKGYQPAELYTDQEFNDALTFLQDLEEKGTYDKSLGVLIGLRRKKDSERKNDFEWRSPHTFNFSRAFWATDEPNNVKNNENCVAYTLKRKNDTDKVGWNDVPCDIQLPILCKNRVKKSCDKCEKGWKPIGTDCVKVMNCPGCRFSDAKNICNYYEASICNWEDDEMDRYVVDKMKEGYLKSVWTKYKRGIKSGCYYEFNDESWYKYKFDGWAMVWAWVWVDIDLDLDRYVWAYTADGVVCWKSCGDN